MIREWKQRSRHPQRKEEAIRKAIEHDEGENDATMPETAELINSLPHPLVLDDVLRVRLEAVTISSRYSAVGSLATSERHLCGHLPTRASRHSVQYAWPEPSLKRCRFRRGATRLYPVVRPFVKRLPKWLALLCGDGESWLVKVSKCFAHVPSTRLSSDEQDLHATQSRKDHAPRRRRHGG